jgi:hypothetical protein
MKVFLISVCLQAAYASQDGVIAHDSVMSCVSQDIGMRSLLQNKLGGSDCEAMCKKIGAYPDCQCPGFNGEPASDGDTRACYTQYCQDPKSPCPTDAFVNCVKANTKSFLQWQQVLRQVDQKFSMMLQLAQNKKPCNQKDLGMLALVQLKLNTSGADCEAMCKKLGAYPDCQCPGFNGEPASDDDTRACYTQYCQDPKSPSPTDAFVNCVKANTKSFLQWQQVLHQVDQKCSMMLQVATSKKSCNQKDLGMRALVQVKAATLGADCEAMCKKLGAYPNCQCPGFNGEPATDDDTRSCYTQNCQDPKSPCPTDAFVTCVKANTKSFLQWQQVMRQVDQKFSMMLQVARRSHELNTTNAK